MICPSCGLPDSYRGQGDGIGSCDCPRCYCCGAGPQDCYCSQDWDDDYDDSGDPADYLCNDTACPWRRARVEAKRDLTGAFPVDGKAVD
jgi:hypothetical protein